MERETGFEPATPSLEGSRSSQLSYSRLCLTLRASVSRPPTQGRHSFVTSKSHAPWRLSVHWWGEEDSNLRRHEPTDLQSAPFGRLGISPRSAQ
jgi:hypothetical protein